MPKHTNFVSLPFVLHSKWVMLTSVFPTDLWRISLFVSYYCEIWPLVFHLLASSLTIWITAVMSHWLELEVQNKEIPNWTISVFVFPVQSQYDKIFNVNFYLSLPKFPCLVTAQNQPELCKDVASKHSHRYGRWVLNDKGQVWENEVLLSFALRASSLHLSWRHQY